MSVADYLAREATQPERHEFIDGQVSAMAGVQDRHATVAGNLYITLRQHLSGSPCRTYMSDMRPHVAVANSYFYPDVLVTCSPLDLANAMVKSEPKLIVEVLSPTTAACDRGLKFWHYRTLPRLWVLHPFGPGEAVELTSVALTATAAQLFAEVAES